MFRLGDDLVNVAEMGSLCQVTRQGLELEDLGKKNNSLEVSKVEMNCSRVKISAKQMLRSCNILSICPHLSTACRALNVTIFLQETTVCRELDLLPPSS